MISALLRDSKSRKRNKSDQRPASHGGLLADLLDVNLRRLASLRLRFRQRNRGEAYLRNSNIFVRRKQAEPQYVCCCRPARVKCALSSISTVTRHLNSTRQRVI